MSAENALAWWLIQKLVPVVYTPQGGINTQAIETELRIHRVPIQDRAWLYDMIIEFCSHSRNK